jgi:prepilin peptidase CpaA
MDPYDVNFCGIKSLHLSRGLGVNDAQYDPVSSTATMNTSTGIENILMDVEVFLLIVLFVLLTLSAITDIKWKKIPNFLTFPVMLIGLTAHGFTSGVLGLIYSFEGLFLGLALLIVFYFFGVMGAGDVKLMGAVGSLLGPAGIFKAFLFTAIVGGIYALIVLSYKDQLLCFKKQIMPSLKLSLITRRPMFMDNDGKASPILCYGIAIALGTSLSIFF